MKFKFPLCGSSCFSSSRSNSKPTISTTSPGEQNHGNLRIFSTQELQIATRGFSSSNKIGEGAFGSVYRGHLADGSVVAVKAWQAYKSNKLMQVVDPALKMNFPEEEAFRFLMVSLLCVQETAKLRPHMSMAVKMLTNETDIRDVQISQPGLVPNLKDIRLPQKHTSESTSSGGSTIMSLPSTTYF
ncbi:hypothetical protein GH714_039261 [Hevea brasiliensis]|uniref:Serine-threonine/tyrosine-protein kinase catalytic domain-containing protein n=1 Tax=Hevea brasiliensis TaxID=3981 RepID=A0A6A6KNT8_HEVBR|nr:hypothetical protein GH714_039261 [Hevea brasiliensis]